VSDAEKLENLKFLEDLYESIDDVMARHSPDDMGRDWNKRLHDFHAKCGRHAYRIKLDLGIELPRI